MQNPDVWSAVMQNPELVDFLQTHKTAFVHPDVKDASGDSSEAGQSESSPGKGFMEYVEDVKQKINVTVEDVKQKINVTVAYTAMLHAYSSAEKWDNAFALFQEMEMKGIQPDLIACSALMRAFNKGNQAAKVLVVAEYMQDRNIPMNDTIYFEMLSACSILRDWRKTIELIEMMEPSFNTMSIGLLNQLLHSIGKLGKTETMMKVFYKIVATGAEINNSTYSVLLKNLLAAGNWRKYLEVMEWMEDSGVQPSVEMYQSILAFAQSGGREYSIVIQDRVDCLRRKTPV